MNIHNWNDTWGTINWAKDPEDEIKQKITEFYNAGVDFNMDEEDDSTEDLDEMGTYTPLDLAVENSSVSVVDLMVKYGANVKLRSSSLAFTPLHFAAGAGKTENAKYIIDHVLSDTAKFINEKGFENRTALHFAAKYGYAETAKLFIENGADVDVQDEDGKTALHLATEYYGDLETVKTLIAAGADVNKEDKNDNTPLYYAIEESKADVVNALIAAGADPDRVAYSMCQVVKNGDTEIVKALIAASYKVDIIVELDDEYDRYGYTPLCYAVKGGHVEIVKALIAADADMSPRGLGNRTLLHLAASSKHEKAHEVVEELIKAYIDRGDGVVVLDEQDEDGRTPLHLAALNGDVETIKVLMKNGADIDIQDKYDGNTALHFAANSACAEAVKTLVENGADVNIQDKYGKTALILFASKYHDNRETINVLTRNGANVNTQDEEGKTALHYAARNGNERTVKALVESGAYVDTQDKNGKTALHYAVDMGNVETVKILVENGIDVNIKNASGWTALDLNFDPEDKEIKNLIENASQIRANYLKTHSKKVQPKKIAKRKTKKSENNKQYE